MAKHYRAYFVIGACCTLAAMLDACSNGDDGTTSPAIDGSGPSSALIQGSDGNFYGSTAAGGQFNHGTVFRITPDGDDAVLYSFSGGTADGAGPGGALVQGSDRNFYGTTVGGGMGECPTAEPIGYTGPPPACGTVFKLTPSGAEEVVHFFSGNTDGGAPTGGLVQSSDGSFYGTTDADALPGNCCGTVFKITLAGDERVLYPFPDGAIDGSIPSSLVQGTDGNFYGTTLIGGSSADGTVFETTPTGTTTVLHSFSAGGDGQLPNAPLVLGSDGNFYGTTPFGGVSANPAPVCEHGCGTVFVITPTGAETVLYAFGGGTDDGANPYGPLFQADDGNLYGTTNSGGTGNCSGGCGTVFKITPGGVETVLYSFAGGTADGASPGFGLVQARDGNFYGTAATGGEFNSGVVFKLTPAGVETVLHSFGGGTNP